jgi:hypothetical protein
MAMTDCFVSTLDISPNRIEWSRKTIEAYIQEPSLRLTILDAGSAPEQLAWFAKKGLTVIDNPREGSIFRRFLLAESLTQSDPFILSDNDCFPKAADWLVRGLDLAKARPQYGYIVYRMVHCDFARDTDYSDSEVRSIHKGGGIGIIRKGARTAAFEVPAIYNPSNADDKCYCDAIKKSGKQVGMFEKLYMEHAGRVESTAGLYN